MRPNQRRRLPIWKKLVFSLVTTCLFLATAELILAVCGVRPALTREDPFVGFVSSIPLFVEHTAPDGTVTFETADNKLPYFNRQSFPKHKRPNTFRIFCMGGSTAYGHPYRDPSSFCGWLRRLLPAADDSRNWEVVNAAGISYASYRVAALMVELADYQPDLFVVYCGHNEFLEERTYHSLRERSRLAGAVCACLSRTRSTRHWHRCFTATGTRLPTTGVIGN